MLPPTMTISSISPLLILASRSRPSRGATVRRNAPSHICSNLARVITTFRSSPSSRLSTSIDVCVAEDSVRFARSHAVRRRRSARAFPRRSSFVLRWNSDAQCSTRALSKSSPPRCVSPAVARTSNTPSSRVRTLRSCVPPPQSKIRTLRALLSLILSRPYAIAAAVGSLIMRSTSRPAIVPASFVAWRCASLKYAGTVITAFFTSWPRYASAVSFIFVRTMAEISSGRNCFVSPLNSTSILGRPFSSTTVNGQCLRSATTVESLKRRPMSRFASKTVFLGFVAATCFAASPTRRSSAVKLT